MRRALVAALLASLAVACRSKPVPVEGTLGKVNATPTASSAQPATSKPNAPFAEAAPVVSGTPLASSPGPAPSGASATRAERENVLLSLFDDPSVATRAPLVDLEAGRDFDWGLRDRLAPRVTGVRGQVRMGETSVDGPLDKNLVQRIVRQNYGRFRLCYERGLVQNPNLQGRVVVKFVIDTDGNVVSSTDAGSDLPDAGVVQCMAAVIHRLAFPQPAKRVTVRHELKLAPG